MIMPTVIGLPLLVFLLVCPVWTGQEGRAAESGPLKGMTAAHNSIRSKLDLPPLTWSDRLAEHARQRARYLAEKNGCRLRHDTGSGFGENLYWASSIRWSDGRREIQPIDATQVVRTWGQEQADYDHRRRTCRKTKRCGHYTQIIWRRTIHLGCAMAICADKGQVWVCLYDPPGNFIGQSPY